MSATKIRPNLTSRDVAAWPFLSALLLLVMFYVKSSILSGVSFTLNMDGMFWIAASIICIGHILAFISMPLIILKTRAVTQDGLANFAIMGLFTIMIHSFFRFTWARLSTMDCANSCVDTMLPRSLEDIISVMVIIVLSIAFAVFFIISRRRMVRGY
jgi:hypothetical protein